MSVRVLAFAAMLSLSTPRLDASSIYLLEFDNMGFNVPTGIHSGTTIRNPYSAGGTISGFSAPPDSSYYYSYNAYGTPGLLHLSMEAENTDNTSGIDGYI